MSSKHAIDESSVHRDEPLKRETPPVRSAPATAASLPAGFAADFQTLAQQVQDVKNATYNTLPPENQAKLDAAITTITTMKGKYGLG